MDETTDPRVLIARAIGGSMTAIVLITVAFDQNLWPVSIISLALAIVGVSLASMIDHKKKW